MLSAGGGWGRSELLEVFVSIVDTGDSSASVVAAVGGRNAPEGFAEQAAWLESLVHGGPVSDTVTRILGLDRPTGGLGRLIDAVGAWGMVVGKPAGLATLGVRLGLDYLAFKAAGKDTRVIETVRRLGALLASISVERVPVVVVVDDADLIDVRLIEAFLVALLEPVGGRVLVVAAARQSSAVYKRLIRDDRFGPTAKRFSLLDGDFGMGEQDRRALVEELLPAWGVEATDRLVKRTVTFGDIYRVAVLGGAADVATAADPVTKVDQLADTALVNLRSRLQRWSQPGPAVSSTNDNSSTR